jgi:hypothetical protein
VSWRDDGQGEGENASRAAGVVVEEEGEDGGVCRGFVSGRERACEVEGGGEEAGGAVWIHVWYLQLPPENKKSGGIAMTSQPAAVKNSSATTTSAFVLQWR